MTLRTLNYENYGIFLIMGNAGFCPSTVGIRFLESYKVSVRQGSLRGFLKSCYKRFCYGSFSRSFKSCVLELLYRGCYMGDCKV